jgi:hypothetical protein
MATAMGGNMANTGARWMQKWQKNQIFEAIQSVGLDPSEFDLDDNNAEVRIKHKWSESCFIVGGNSGHYVGSSVVGDAPAWPYEVYSWQALISRVGRWLGEVKHDLETPDLWAELRREAELLGAGSVEVTENTRFTLHEQKEIAGRLQEMAEYAKRNYSLSNAQMRVLEAKIEYLIDAARRLGRIDWRNVLAGAILGFIVTAALPPESAHHILLTLLRAIGHLYGLPELPSG